MDSAEQQIVDSITTTSNILVTVSSNPTVDELSAALGLTLILDKLEKRATAIFSGAMPAAITFLEPNKTFEPTADSLRDFIIALNKEKADHLRYKVDGDVVKIFITPYKTTLSQADLEFSQGDYNVEMVLALGVNDPEHLDKALEAHGKILHDAKVMTITAGANKSTLGTTDWHDDKASSLSEMIVSLVNAMKSSENLLDQQTSTALLTGIVSATDRFSNDRTSSQVMTLAAQLMAGGANQQLIAAKLQEAGGLPAVQPSAAGEGASESADGTELVIERDETEVPAAPTSTEKVIEPLPPPPEPAAPVSNEDTDQLELEKQLAGLTAPSTGTMADIEKELQDAAVSAGGQTTPAAESTQSLEVSTAPDIEVPATDVAMPGFEATPPPVDNPAPSSDMVGERSGPVGILPPDQQPAMNGTMAGDNEDPIVDPFNAPESLTAQTGTTITPDASAGTPEGAAILSAPPEAPALPEVPELPSLPSLDTVMESSAEPVLVPEAQIVADVPELPPLPPLPPLPGDASLPPLPPPPPPPVFDPAALQAGAVSGDIFGDTSVPTVPAAPAAPAPPTPGQFQIPGQ